MAADKSSEGSSGKNREDGDTEAAARRAAEAIPEALRDAGRRAADLAQNPVARSLLAAGLVTAAAALAANKNVRDTTLRNVKDAQEATEAALEAATENANRVGAAIINAATEAVQKMMSMSAGMMAPSGGDSRGSDPSAGETTSQAPRPSEPPQPDSASSSASQPQAEGVSNPNRSPRAKVDGAQQAAKPAARKPRVKATPAEGETVGTSATSRTPKPKGAHGGKSPSGKKAGSGHARKGNNAKQGPGGS